MIEFHVKRELDFADGWMGMNSERLNNFVANRILKNFIQEVSKKAEDALELHMPQVTRKMLEHTTINMPQIRGGIWDWEASIGIEPIPEATDPLYPLYVLRGTGIHKGLGGGPGQFGPGEPTFGIESGNFPKLSSQTRQGVIRPESGNFMSFVKESGERVVTRYTKGQEPQDFLTPAVHDVNTYIETHRAELVAKLKATL